MERSPTIKIEIRALYKGAIIYERMEALLGTANFYIFRTYCCNFIYCHWLWKNDTDYFVLYDRLSDWRETRQRARITQMGIFLAKQMVNQT